MYFIFTSFFAKSSIVQQIYFTVLHYTTQICTLFIVGGSGGGGGGGVVALHFCGSFGVCSFILIISVFCLLFPISLLEQVNQQKCLTMIILLGFDYTRQKG